jgi:3-isopropylmalate/(R)-2-methylmalate dehydratase small subunit
MISEPLVTLEGVAAALLQANINTDVIAPTVRRVGRNQLGAIHDGGKRLFGAWRYDIEGVERADFVLNQAPFRKARFLIAGENFACGSSRESAASWLRDFGIRCVIAPSFGGIFYDNCFRNGVLPVQMPAPIVLDLAAQAASGGVFRLNVAAGWLLAPSGATWQVSLPAFRRGLLLSGGDEITLTQRRRAEIVDKQAQLRSHTPWVWPSREDVANAGR